jgi:hypothetical protein
MVLDMVLTMLVALLYMAGIVGLLFACGRWPEVVGAGLFFAVLAVLSYGLAAMTLYG